MSKGEVTARRNKCNSDFERLVTKPRLRSLSYRRTWSVVCSDGMVSSISQCRVWYYDTQGIQCPAYLYLISIGNVKILVFTIILIYVHITWQVMLQNKCVFLVQLSVWSYQRLSISQENSPDKKNSKYFFVVYCVSRILVWSPFKALKGMKDLINLYSTFLIDFASQPVHRVYILKMPKSYSKYDVDIWLM